MTLSKCHVDGPFATLFYIVVNNPTNENSICSGTLLLPYRNPLDNIV